MPYSIRKSKCKQSDGDAGSIVLSYTDNKGKKHRNCHTSRKKAKAQIAAIEMPEGVEDMGESWIPLAVRITEILEEELARLAGGLRLDESRSDEFREKQKRDYGERIGIDYDLEIQERVEDLVKAVMDGELALPDVPGDLVPLVARGLRDEGEFGLAKELKALHSR